MVGEHSARVQRRSRRSSRVTSAWRLEHGLFCVRGRAVSPVVSNVTEPAVLAPSPADAPEVARGRGAQGSRRDRRRDGDRARAPRLRARRRRDRSSIVATRRDVPRHGRRWRDRARGACGARQAVGALRAGAEPRSSRDEELPLGAELGMCCGGGVDVLVEPIAALVPSLGRRRRSRRDRDRAAPRAARVRGHGRRRARRVGRGGANSRGALRRRRLRRRRPRLPEGRGRARDDPRSRARSARRRVGAEARLRVRGRGRQPREGEAHARSPRGQGLLRRGPRRASACRSACTWARACPTRSPSRSPRRWWRGSGRALAVSFSPCSGRSSPHARSRTSSR